MMARAWCVPSPHSGTIPEARSSWFVSLVSGNAKVARASGITVARVLAEDRNVPPTLTFIKPVGVTLAARRHSGHSTVTPLTSACLHVETLSVGGVIWVAMGDGEGEDSRAAAGTRRHEHAAS